MGLLAFLAACGDADEANPVSGGPISVSDIGIDGDDETVEGIPNEISNNFDGVAFDPAAETLVISVGGLDAGSETSTYTRNASLDVPGYLAFVKQDDPLDRFFLALADRSPDGTSQSFSVTDGGQFNRFFGGTLYSRIGAYTQPTTGLVSYAGEYAGSTNVGERATAQLLAVPTGLSETVTPKQPLRVVGDIFLNVDFSENKINGEIYNRQMIDSTGAVAVQTGTGITFTGETVMPNISLIEADIEADGTFSGTAEIAITQDNAGEYAGTFGGQGATSVAGGVHLDRFTGNLDSEEEYGSFALGRCGTAGDSAICDGLGE